MRPGMLMLVLLLVSACIPALGLYATPYFSAALVAGAVCSAAGYLVFRFRAIDPVLFLIAQPCVFIAWYVSPFLSLALDSALVLALLFSLGLLHAGSNLTYTALFFLSMAIVTLFLSNSTHVILPIFLFIPAAGLACFVILWLAYRTTTRIRGGMI